MSVEDATHEDFSGNLLTDPSYFRIFFTALTSEGSLGYNDQTIENGSFSASFTPLTQTTYEPSLLNASVTQGGYVSVLAVDASTGHVTYIRERRDETGSRFAAPQDLGKPDNVANLGETLLLNGLNGRPNVFLISADPTGEIWWKYENPNTVVEETITVVPPGTDTPIEVTVLVEVPPAQPWSDWQQLPGALSSLTATQNADGRILLAGINSDGIPYMNLQSSDRPFLPEGWDGWEEISDGLTGFEQLVCGLDMNALVHIFARIGDKIYMKAQQQVSASSFGAWVLFGTFPSSVHSMALSSACNDGLYLVAQLSTGTNCPLYAKYQTGPTSENWSTWDVIGHVAQDCDLVLQPNANAMLSLFSCDPNGDAAYLNQQTLDHWAAVWTALGSGYATIATTQDITPNPE
ncbi:hypothetical protein TM1040_3289 (plasmid) [Ruegeria sp. TM1040]|uniref:hypothetical protein n=1 Tax=Ruegeria sp. (strain TM1040) TaxID=292414 RepID=UPI0000462C40|nr:hypothetical protein [Ruegeria sp. TM1040]ABF62263.1 hypothetical protein TM1040_3289 [Ruegeria sp. TM1040]